MPKVSRMNDANNLSIESASLVGTTGFEQEPILYSRKAIDWFSIIMAPLFGCVMLAMNIRSLDRSEGIIPVLSFGISYFLFVILINELVTPMIPVHLWNGIGVVFLHYRFWKRYIGDDQRFQKRSIWKPLVVAILISAFFIWVIIISGTE